ncbi:hypothetical protein IFT77_16445 [Frigoribacterium sp. CFBP 13729]|jgi:hypothetical protein|uniref:hypothetical protein n=1 Tax=unclassified Frigoribacterium TaxID=2627005 RepID=UPI001780FA72|nr:MULTISPECIES: hypothetical protein [unclassified Frigoribacterium]MBD8586168.1 hypothetical protein [Frigoribacterium sp. CFBP 8766]MBD8612082.1 hypothetical protein [Frigoribacterium sp. CFBP 13729]
MSVRRKPYVFINAPEAIVVFAAPIIAVGLTVGFLHANIWAVLLVMAVGYALSVSYFRRLRPTVWVDLVLLGSLPIGVVVLILVQDHIGPTYYAWLLSCLSGLIIGGRTWRRRQRIRPRG